ncbi:MAG: hypothetical protein IKN38_06600, partial [Clostridia bacterium]|nr:hypothetical protein [Clostridia bacterium]
MNGRKRALLIWAGAFALLAAAAFILSMVLRGIQDGEESDPDGYIPYSEYDFFYEPDRESALYERDCYDEYLQHDRTLYYTDGALTRAVTESDRASFPEDVLFFEDYFASLEAGDSKAYDALFDPAFIAENGETPDFTPQMTYGRRVERVRDVSLEGAQEAVFD